MIPSPISSSEPSAAVQHIDEAMEITRKDVADELDGLPPRKMHCSNLAADALHGAIEDYKSKKAGK